MQNRNLHEEAWRAVVDCARVMTGAPEFIANYRVLSRLGAGGMGEVFLAEDARLDRRVAVKRLKAGGPARPPGAGRPRSLEPTAPGGAPPRHCGPDPAPRGRAGP